MNYTENYHLPQWAKEDRIMMEDFNQMCLDMEAGLCQNAGEAAEAAQTAQATADKAVRDAAAAQAKADAAYAPGQPPYVVGTYKGTGAAQAVTVGFRPSFVIIGGPYSLAYQYHIALGSGQESPRLSFTDTGFTVKPRYVGITGTTMTEEEMPYLAKEGYTYSYIAFR